MSKVYKPLVSLDALVEWRDPHAHLRPGYVAPAPVAPVAPSRTFTTVPVGRNVIRLRNRLLAAPVPTVTLTPEEQAARDAAHAACEAARAARKARVVSSTPRKAPTGTTRQAPAAFAPVTLDTGQVALVKPSQGTTLVDPRRGRAARLARKVRHLRNPSLVPLWDAVKRTEREALDANRNLAAVLRALDLAPVCPHEASLRLARNAVAVAARNAVAARDAYLAAQLGVTA